MKRVSGFNTRVSMEDADTPVVLGTPLEVEDLIEDQMATEEINGLVVEMQNDLNALDEAHEAVDALQETQATIAEKLETPEAVTVEDVAIAQEALKLPLLLLLSYENHIPLLKVPGALSATPL